MRIKLDFLILLLVFSLTLSFTACKKDPVDTTPKPSYYVQNWIYDNMQYWYFWNSQIPANADTTMLPEPFFYSLLYNGINGDRFSWIEADYTTLINELNGVTKEAGFDFRLYLASSTSTDVIGQISYIKKGSPAEYAGLKRGDIFYAINGTQITTSNYKTLLSATGAAYTLGVKRYDPDTQAMLSDKTYSLTPVELAENPVLMDSVYTIGSKKVGYLVYNFFSPGSGSSKPYDQQVDNVFTKFKSNGVNEVILDLRFNGGGSVSSAINLASLLVPGYNSSKIFFNFQYNNQVMSYILNEPTLGSAYLHQKFVAKTSNNVGDNLTRLFVLTSTGTASASELIINGLRPYLPVITVGDTTYGKNVGSITITDTQNTTNTWGMQPIVFKMTNSVDFSDYGNGFAPEPANYDADNYFSLRPLGDTKEPLLNRALYIITDGKLKSAQRSAIMHGNQIKGANESINPYKTTMYVDPEMSLLKKTR